MSDTALRCLAVVCIIFLASMVSTVAFFAGRHAGVCL